jgi:hypothetical protein
MWSDEILITVSFFYVTGGNCAVGGRELTSADFENCPILAHESPWEPGVPCYSRSMTTVNPSEIAWNSLNADFVSHVQPAT